MTTAAATNTKFHESTRFGILPSTVSFQIREPGSALTHFAALILTAMGAGPLLMRARQNGSAYTITGMIVFILTTCWLYAASTTYHTVVLDEKKTTVFRKIDHISISIMIAGTYTPICLTALRETIGIPLLIAVWTLAALGVVLKLFWVTCPKWLSSVIYAGMGWMCAFAIPALAAALPGGAIFWLVAGGVVYTIGAVIYALHPKKFDAKHVYFGSHEIFHLFIMGGTACHFVLMYQYIAMLG